MITILVLLAAPCIVSGNYIEQIWEPGVATNTTTDGHVPASPPGSWLAAGCTMAQAVECQHPLANIIGICADSMSLTGSSLVECVEDALGDTAPSLGDAAPISYIDLFEKCIGGISDEEEDGDGAENAGDDDEEDGGDYLEDEEVYEEKVDPLGDSIGQVFEMCVQRRVMEKLSGNEGVVKKCTKKTMHPAEPQTLNECIIDDEIKKALVKEIFVACATEKSPSKSKDTALGHTYSKLCIPPVTEPKSECLIQVVYSSSDILLKLTSPCPVSTVDQIWEHGLPGNASYCNATTGTCGTSAGVTTAPKVNQASQSYTLAGCTMAQAMECQTPLDNMIRLCADSMSLTGWSLERCVQDALDYTATALADSAPYSYSEFFGKCVGGLSNEEEDVAEDDEDREDGGDDEGDNEGDYEEDDEVEEGVEEEEVDPHGDSIGRVFEKCVARRVMEKLAGNKGVVKKCTKKTLDPAEPQTLAQCIIDDEIKKALVKEIFVACATEKAPKASKTKDTALGHAYSKWCLPPLTKPQSECNSCACLTLFSLGKGEVTSDTCFPGGKAT